MLWPLAKRNDPLPLLPMPSFWPAMLICQSYVMGKITQTEYFYMSDLHVTSLTVDAANNAQDRHFIFFLHWIFL